MSGRFPNQVDVFIAGGGPAGLATAIAARQRGLSVLVADGAATPIDKACGEGLMPDGIDALRQLGVSLPESAGRAFRGIRFVNGRQTAEAAFPHGTAYGIRRTVFHQILLEQAAAAGVNLQWRSPVSGLDREGAHVAGDVVRSRWIVGADGAASRVRRWAGLDRYERNRIRFAARCHYRVAPWTELMELHWGRHAQVYVTPVAADEICVAMISNDQRFEFDDELAEFPELSNRLKDSLRTSSERGAITVSRKLRHVYRERVVLVGDASAGVDAITGEGLCLAFRQAALLAECLASDDLARYEEGHSRLIRRPALMARLMLLVGRNDTLRRRVMQVFETTPQMFAAMLSMHVGVGSTRDYVSNGISLGWQLLKA